MRRAHEVTIQRFHREAPALTSDMTKSELAEVLESLPMHKDRCLVEIDREVRDFIVRVLRQR